MSTPIVTTTAYGKGIDEGLRLATLVISTKGWDNYPTWAKQIKELRKACNSLSRKLKPKKAARHA